MSQQQNGAAVDRIADRKRLAEKSGTESHDFRTTDSRLLCAYSSNIDATSIAMRVQGGGMDDRRRGLLKKAAYVAPLILTLQATSAVAKSGSEKEWKKPSEKEQKNPRKFKLKKARR